MNTEPYTYLVTLRPTGNFYFGGERHFSFKGQKNYLVNSNRFPQQTSVLGMLRYELLRGAGLLNGVDKTAEAHLIGASGFNDENTDGYGIIQSLSPVFLHEQKSREAYITFGCNRQNGQTITPEPLEGKTYSGTAKEEIILLNRYSAKDLLDEAVMSPETGKICLLNEIFLQPEQTGNQKNNKQNETEALYKQTYCRFARYNAAKQPVTWCFAFYLQTSQPFTLSQSLMVQVGGDQSAFIMEYIPAENKLFNTTAITGAEAVQITLLNDAFSNTPLEHLSRAAIAFTADFRYIETTAATKNYHQVSYRKEKDTTGNMLRSRKYNLYKKGSVFWVTAAQLADFTNALRQPAYKTIGYNYYSINKI